MEKFMQWVVRLIKKDRKLFKSDVMIEDSIYKNVKTGRREDGK